MAGRPLTKSLEKLNDALEIAWEPETPRRTTPEPYSDKLASELIDLASMGMTPSEIAQHWAVSVETLKEWGEAHTDFDRAMARARTAAQAWWETQARKAMATRDNKFPAGAWAMVMRARFAEYREKVEINHTVDITKRLVLMDLRDQPPGLPSERSSGDHNALANHATVKLGHGQTVERELESETVLEGEIVGRHE